MLTETLSLQRQRLLLGALVCVSVGLGLLSRTALIDRHSFIGQYAGDTLWAMMVFYLVAMIFPRLLVLKVGIIALSFSFLVEVSQLSSAPILVMLRSHTLGKLILGRGFLWSDFVCYSIGILLAAISVWILLNRVFRHKTAR